MNAERQLGGDLFNETWRLIGESDLATI